MPSFAERLRDFRLGASTEEQLLAQADQELREPGVDAVGLLATLYGEQASNPDQTRRLETVEQHILGHIRAVDGDDTGDVMVPVLPPGVGSTLKKRFKLIERIGRGGMSSVFKGIDLRKIEARADDPFVAVKVLNPPFSDEARALALLQSEAGKLQSLAHPNIVQLIDCDREGRAVFLVQEYLEGEPLEKRLQRAGGAPLPTEDAARIIESVASALAVAHRDGIMHGDLKPANVIVTDRAEVKVIDFGIARLLSRETESTALRGEITALTQAYASPEILEKADPDPRDDIYSLACIAHEVLTGEHPYGRTDAVHARNAGLKLIRRGNLSRRRYRAIAHALAFERDERTPTASQFIAELRDDSAGRVLRFGAYACLLLALVAIGFFAWLRHARKPRLVSAPSTTSVTPGEVFRDCPTCPLVKAVPAGSFVQGSLDDDPDAAPSEKPRHSVAIPAAFGISAYEITVAEYREFAEDTGRAAEGCEVYDGAWQMRPDRSWRNPGFEQTASHPVVCVSWTDARDYAAWLSARTHVRYRLPSASEWEYAARAGSGGAAPWEDPASACEHANVADQTAVEQFPGWRADGCADGHVFTASVGSFAPNAFGLFDVIGNAFEWVEDCWHDDYRDAPADGAAWRADPCREHEIRGGSWFSSPELARSAYRNRFEADHRANSVGFRVLREIRP